MKLYRRFQTMPGKGRVVTLGVFDGVHIGHAAVFKTVQKEAKKNRVPAGVITFDDHPHGTLAPDQRPPRLANQSQCLARMQALGMDEVFLIRFTTAFAAVLADDFVRRILVKQLKVRHVVVGRDFRFGRGGLGTVQDLSRWGRQHGFGVTVVRPIRRENQIVSSSLLRKMVSQGDMARVRQWLGWPYTLHGKVVHGDGRGGKIGIPTANIKTLHEIVPGVGTYAVAVRLGRTVQPGLCHIGNRPTFHQWGPQTIEVHIPGWRGDLYGRCLVVGFLARLRGEQAFPGAEALLRQVQKDWGKTQKLWTKKPVDSTMV